MRRNNGVLTGLALLIGFAGAASAHGQQEHPIVWSAHLDGAPRVSPGASVVVVAAAAIPPGWHVYSLTQAAGGPIRMTMSVGPANIARLGGSISASRAIVADDPNFGIQTETYEDSATFHVPVAIAPNAAVGSRQVDVIVTYQACNARYCLPPRADTLATTILVAGTPNAEGGAPPSVSSGQGFSLSEFGGSSESFVLFLWLAATMGALSLLTPCVFPMVPITISYFSGRGAGHRAQAIRDAVVYGAGIVGAFTGLGLGLALLFGVSGLNRFAANPWLNLAIALLFAMFALSLFGAFDLVLPSGVLTRLDALSRNRALPRDGATLLMGATFAVTSFTCTAPFVGTLLVSVTQGSWRWPALGLLIFSSVFALPFVVLALIPSAVSKLPRSGPWMVTLKGTLAFVELAAAMKFLSNADLVEGWGVVTRSVVIASWVVLGLGLASYLFGVRLKTHTDSPVRSQPIVAAIVLAATVWLSLGLAGRRLGELDSFLPPPSHASTTASASGELGWILDDYQAALAQARMQHKPVLIDFTGYTCTNCRWMEANMFPRQQVQGALERFVRVRLFTDGNDARDRSQGVLQQNTFRTSALPLYAIVDSLGRPGPTFLGMTRSTDEFVQFLVSGSGMQ